MFKYIGIRATGSKGELLNIFVMQQKNNRFAAESQNLWGDIFMASYYFFGYNDARIENEMLYV